MDGTAERRFTFGHFEVDFETGELRRSGIRLALQGRPLEVLAILLTRPGRIIPRAELREHLWADDQYGDFDHMLNNAVNRLRTALGDSAHNPRFVETVPRRGYRFIAPVREIAATSTGPSLAEAPATQGSERRTMRPVLAALAAVIAIPLVLFLSLRTEPASPATAAGTRVVRPQVDYLKGRYLWIKKQPEAVQRSRDYFLAAIERDPTDALAWSGLADAYNFMGGIGLLAREDAYSRATQAAETALRQDPDSGEAYASLAEARFRLGPDDEQVEPLFLRARELAPRYAIGRYWYGMYLERQDRLEEALVEVRLAHQLAPLNLRIQVDLGMVLWRAGQKAAGRLMMEEALALDGQSQKTYLGLGWLEWREGRLQHAASAFKRCVELSPEIELHRARFNELARAQGPIDEIRVAAWRDLALESVRCQQLEDEPAIPNPVMG